MSEVKVPEGYKQTEVGVIPNDWLISEMRELTTLMTNGFVGIAKLHYTASSNGVLYIQGYNVKENSFNFHGIKRVTPSFHTKNSKSCLKTGDVLMVQTGDVGMTTVVPPELENSNCHALIINRFKNKLNSTYFSYYFNSIQGRARLKEIEVGTTMKHINVGSLLSFIVPVPPKPEQTAIATALSDVDNLIGSLEKLIAKKEAIKTGTMQQLLTGKTRLPEFATRDDGSPKGFKQTELGRSPEDWEVNYIGKIANFRNGVAHENFIDTNGRYIAVNSKFISTEGKVYKRTKILRNPAYKDEILMVMSDLPNGKALAKCFLVTVNNAFSVNQRICSLNIVSDIPKFVFYQLNRNPFYLAFDDGVKQTNLRRQDVLDCPVALPSIKEQTAIATILSDMDTEIQVLQERLEKTRDIKQGLMQQLLTGKVRLAH